MRELENNPNDYRIEPIIDILYDLNRNIKIKIKKLARLVLKTSCGSYIDSNIIKIAKFSINK